MKKLLKKLFSGVLSAALLLFTMPLALAANDLEGSWARPYIEYLGQIPYNGETGGVIRPNSTTGNYDPDKQVTRAEFMRYINRAFNFTAGIRTPYRLPPSTAIFRVRMQFPCRRARPLPASR